MEKTFLLHLSAHWGDLIEQIKKESVIYTLSDFIKKLLVQRNTKINEKRNGVITLLWLLRLQENPDHKKVSSLYNTAVVTFFP